MQSTFLPFLDGLVQKLHGRFQGKAKCFMKRKFLISRHLQNVYSEARGVWS